MTDAGKKGGVILVGRDGPIAEISQLRAQADDVFLLQRQVVETPQHDLAAARLVTVTAAVIDRIQSMERFTGQLHSDTVGSVPVRGRRRRMTPGAILWSETMTRHVFIIALIFPH